MHVTPIPYPASTAIGRALTHSRAQCWEQRLLLPVR
jgi:hypothetical protein